jgi:phosphoribosylanthranilate isomerase
VVVDAFSEKAYGGTGAVTDWALAAEAARAVQVLLAGGLSAENVGQAVRAVQPYGVDVSSGVEASPGKKDHARIQAFVRAAKLASSQLGVYTAPKAK